MIKNSNAPAFVTVTWTDYSSTVFGPFPCIHQANMWLDNRTPNGEFIDDAGNGISFLSAQSGLFYKHSDRIEKK